ncbi:unnamed protein product [Periconia digitata]|uniref:Uncharacterized protein n=1 Tax=Periconia digitata TaxID=1303443 RepID=A0A9W4U2J9_9PLEO|nr:unnamed protein product [Periconia digitata]
MDPPQLRRVFKDSDDGVLSRLEKLELNLSTAQKEVTGYHKAVEQLSELNQNLQNHVKTLEEKILKLEAGIASTEMGTINSTTPNKKNQLTISIPNSNSTNAPWFEMPTPISALGPNTGFPLVDTLHGEHTSLDPPNPFLMVPNTPKTPNKSRVTHNLLRRKPIHDLTAQLPPANVRLPLIPITDEELIVFFFNGTTHPAFSLRLYARNWGPTQIVGLINNHREVKPKGYMKNTCSVRMTTALRRGLKEYGEVWQDLSSHFFRSVDDAVATDAISFLGDGVEYVDHQVLSMTNSLKIFPTGKGRGIFTESLAWCVENRADIMLSQLHIVALALSRGADPAIAVASLVPPQLFCSMDLDMTAPALSPFHGLGANDGTVER